MWKSIRIILRYNFVLVRFLAIALLVFAAVHCSKSESFDEKSVVDDYFQPNIYELNRFNKDSSFKYSPDSPFDSSDRVSFSALSYFPPSKEYIFLAKLLPFEKQDTVQIRTSRNETKDYLRYGKIWFSHKEKNYSLTAFISIKYYDHGLFFIPFTDETCGEESYAGGRYLEIEYDKDAPPSEFDGKAAAYYILDFNTAYNPWCVYNKHKYNCPLVPPENHIPFAVKAGEKKFHIAND